MSWKGILLLSTIIAVGIFTGFRLAEISGPVPTVTISLDPVKWQLYRTTGPVAVDENKILNSTYSDDACKMLFSVVIGSYIPPGGGAGYSLELAPSFAATSSTKDFAVRSVIFSFGEDSQSFIELEYWDSLVNLSPGGSFQGGQQISSIQFVGNGSSVDFNCRFLVCWYLSTGNDVTSVREITCDVTYFNGTTYKRTVQSFDVTLLGGAYANLNIGSRIADYNTSKAVSGINVWVDGQLHYTPVSGLVVTQGVHNLTAPLAINISGTPYRFAEWSLAPTDNSIMQDISSDLSLTANYEPLQP